MVTLRTKPSILVSFNGLLTDIKRFFRTINQPQKGWNKKTCLGPGFAYTIPFCAKIILHLTRRNASENHCIPRKKGLKFLHFEIHSKYGKKRVSQLVVNLGINDSWSIENDGQITGIFQNKLKVIYSWKEKREKN